jgi:hypothetical protein
MYQGARKHLRALVTEKLSLPILCSPSAQDASKPAQTQISPHRLRTSSLSPQLRGIGPSRKLRWRGREVEERNAPNHPSHSACDLRCPSPNPPTHPKRFGIWVLLTIQKSLSVPVFRLWIISMNYASLPSIRSMRLWMWWIAWPGGWWLMLKESPNEKKLPCPSCPSPFSAHLW